MITPLDIYLVSQCDRLAMLLSVVGAGGFLFALIFFVMSMDDHLGEDVDRRLRRQAEKLFVMACVAWFLFTFAPSSRTVAAMVVVPKIVNSDVMQKDIPDAVKKLLREYIDKAEEARK